MKRLLYRHKRLSHYSRYLHCGGPSAYSLFPFEYCLLYLTHVYQVPLSKSICEDIRGKNIISAEQIRLTMAIQAPQPQAPIASNPDDQDKRWKQAFRNTVFSQYCPPKSERKKPPSFIVCDFQGLFPRLYCTDYQRLRAEEKYL
jgi:hypothetical protein